MKEGRKNKGQLLLSKVCCWGAKLSSTLMLASIAPPDYIPSVPYLDLNPIEETSLIKKAVFKLSLRYQISRSHFKYQDDISRSNMAFQGQTHLFFFSPLQETGRLCKLSEAEDNRGRKESQPSSLYSTFLTTTRALPTNSS